MTTSPTTHFAVQHIDGGVVLTVKDFVGGYRLAISDPRGTEIIAFPATDDLDAAVAQAVYLLADDL